MKNAYFKLILIFYKKFGSFIPFGFLTSRSKSKTDNPKTIIMTISTLFTKN